MRAEDIRRTYLDFFRERDHHVWPSASLIPNDPTVFLTVAGMVPFKPYFLGEVTPDHPRAASVQKCVRIRGKLDDIEVVGTTTRHLTFFEMLGNFSFGDYFKAEAIRWAWALVTDGFGFDPQRLWASVYEDDDEAARLWVEETPLPAERVVRRGAEDNFWSMGGPGPCGPCSEIFYDRGPEYGADGGPDVDENRYLEFWNLVFMQYEQDANGTILGELPNKNVDTGLGMERLAMLLQEQPNVYETDVIRPILDAASEATGVPYGRDEASDVSLRVLADHARSTSFLIADGVLPSNEARGYVLRRLLRRMVLNARHLGTDQPVMPALTDRVIATLGQAWPELRSQASLIRKITTAEEEAFQRTLRSGLTMLDTAIEDAKREHGETEAESEAGDSEAPAARPHLPAHTAFALHDTHGFPIDLTVEIAAERGVEVDRDAFAEYMQAQRDRARAAAKRGDGGVPLDTYRAAAGTVGSTRFVGYTDTEAATEVGAVLDRAGMREAAEEGEEVEIVLPRTPFYAESGGQLGDHGLIRTDTGRLEITDTVAPVEGLHVHRGRVVAGEVHAGQEAHAAIDVERRTSITRGHTATHILHAAIRSLLGDHAQQAGSAIDSGRFRFDFPHFEAVAPEQVAAIEDYVNTRISEDYPVESFETSREEADRMGAIALFGEKYGERVRVVRIGDFSIELCGGTHVDRSPEVQVFTVFNEGSISANTRRIEAITGPEALDHLAKERLVAEQIAQMLKVSPEEAPDRVAALMDRLRAAEKELTRVRQQALLARADGLLESAERVADHSVVAGRVDEADRDGLKSLALELRNRLDRGVVLLGAATDDGKAMLVSAVTKDLADQGVAAAEVLRPAAQAVGGGAGGKGDLAQAGGRNAEALDDALAAGRRAARDLLEGR